MSRSGWLVGAMDFLDRFVDALRIISSFEGRDSELYCKFNIDRVGRLAFRCGDKIGAILEVLNPACTLLIGSEEPCSSSPWRKVAEIVPAYGSSNFTLFFVFIILTQAELKMQLLRFRIRSSQK